MSQVKQITVATSIAGNFKYDLICKFKVLITNVVIKRKTVRRTDEDE